MEPLPSKKRKYSNISAKPTVSTAVKSYVNRIVQKAGEVKYIDFSINGTASSTSAYTVFLDAMAIGANYNNRIGDKIRLRKIEWDFEIVPGDNYNVTRFIIGATRNSNHTVIPTAISTLQGPKDPSWGPYLVDVKSQVYFQPVDGSSSTSIPHIKFFKGSRKLNHTLQYPQSGNNPVNWMLYFQFHSDSIAIPHPSAVGYIRVWYTDV